MIHPKMIERCNIKFDQKALLMKIFSYLEYSIKKKLNIVRCEMMVQILEKMINNSPNKEAT